MNADGIVDERVVFGEAADVPVTGDWNGDRLTDLGVVRNNPIPGCVSTWILQVSDDRKELLKISFGLAGDLPVVGDWNGDGKSDIAIYRIVNGKGAFFLDWNLGHDPEQLIAFGVTDCIPLLFMGTQTQSSFRTNRSERKRTVLDSSRKDRIHSDWCPGQMP